jgi:hypothetical protein
MLITTIKYVVVLFMQFGTVSQPSGTGLIDCFIVDCLTNITVFTQMF